MPSIRQLASVGLIAAGAAAITLAATSATDAATAGSAGAPVATTYHYAVPRNNAMTSKVEFTLSAPPSGFWEVTLHVEGRTSASGVTINCELQQPLSTPLRGYGSPYPRVTDTHLYYSTVTASAAMYLDHAQPVEVGCSASELNQTISLSGDTRSSVELQQITSLVRGTTK